MEQSSVSCFWPNPFSFATLIFLLILPPSTSFYSLIPHPSLSNSSALCLFCLLALYLPILISLFSFYFLFSPFSSLPVSLQLFTTVPVSCFLPSLYHSYLASPSFLLPTVLFLDLSCPIFFLLFLLSSDFFPVVLISWLCSFALVLHLFMAISPPESLLHAF